METDKILARMAQMEQELSTLRAKPAASTAQFDQAAFQQQLVQAMTQDPMGTMKQLGIPVDHVTRVAVVHALGDKATPEQKALAAMGPQISATNSLQQTMEAISRRLDGIEQSNTQGSVRNSLQKLVSDKGKYPSLSKAYAADSSLFDSDVAGHKGSAEELAAKIEDRLSKFSRALGVAQPTSDENVENQTTPSEQGQPATGNSITDVPSLPQTKQGVFTDDDHAKLKQEILQKFNTQ